MIHAIKEDTSLEIIFLIPGPARRVDPGPSRPGPGAGSGLSKKQPRIWPGETRSTRVNPTETQPYFFGNCLALHLLVATAINFLLPGEVAGVNA